MSQEKKSKVPVLRCIEGGECVEEPRRMVYIEHLFKKDEKHVLGVVNSYIHNQKDPTCTKLAHDVRGYSALHLAAERNFLTVAEKLLESGFRPLTPACHDDKKLALHISIEKGFDDMAALIIRNINPADVRRLFVNEGTGASATCKGRGKVEPLPDETADILSLNYLIKSDCTFVKSILVVLDNLKDVHDSGLATVYVKLLEEDGSGLEPKDEEFSCHYHTVFHNLVYAQKEVTNHPVIGMLIDHKWNTWCRRRFVFNFCLYMLSLFALTFSLVTAATADDVRTYDTSLHRTRAFFEVTVCIFALIVLVTEIWQMIRHMHDYWKQFFNWIELLSSSIIFVVLILRFTTEDAHWFVLAVAYILWVIRIFKYAAVSSQTGAYAESLRQILTRNFLPFSLLFIVVNVAFGGVFLLVLKGEGSLQTHDETSSIFGIWFVGLRTMIEAGPIVEYTGSDGYGTAGIIVMLVFMTMTIVVLLNILIAQLSDTYSEIQGDAVKSVRANRVAIITRLERNELKIFSFLIERLIRCGCITWVLSRCGCVKWMPEKGKSIAIGNRKKYYKSVFENIDLKQQYQSYSTLLEDMDEKIQEMRRLQTKTDLIAQTLKSRLRQLDEKIDKNFLEIKNILETKGKSNDGVTEICDSEIKNKSDARMEAIPNTKIKNKSDAKKEAIPNTKIKKAVSEIKDISDTKKKDIPGSNINDMSESNIKDIHVSDPNVKNIRVFERKHFSETEIKDIADSKVKYISDSEIKDISDSEIKEISETDK